MMGYLRHKEFIHDILEAEIGTRGRCRPRLDYRSQIIKDCSIFKEMC